MMNVHYLDLWYFIYNYVLNYICMHCTLGGSAGHVMNENWIEKVSDLKRH